MVSRRLALRSLSKPSSLSEVLRDRVGCAIFSSLAVAILIGCTEAITSEDGVSEPVIVTRRGLHRADTTPPCLSEAMTLRQRKRICGGNGREYVEAMGEKERH